LIRSGFERSHDVNFAKVMFLSFATFSYFATIPEAMDTGEATESSVSFHTQKVFHLFRNPMPPHPKISGDETERSALR
jgi:hypothetical protein